MEAQLVEKEGVKATVNITVPASDVDRKFATVLRQLSRQIRVPGFRPGKAPEGVLVKRIGEETLAQEVRDALVDETYPEAVRELDLAPVHAHFHADAPQRGHEFEFEVHVDLYPEFELPDLDEIVIDTAIPQVTDEMVEQTVERLQRENATLVPVDRPSQPSDTVMIETIVEGAGDEPGSQMPVDLEAVDEALAEQLLGKTIGDVVELKLGGGEETESAATEPETETPETPEAEASGIEAPEAEAGDREAEAGRTLRIRVTNVQEKDKPEAGDELANTLGFENWDDTVAEIRRSIQAQLERDGFEEQREEFVDKLMTHTDFDLPPSLVNRRKVNMIENLTEDLRQRGLTLQQYLGDLGEKGTREEFETELTEAAERGVKRDLILERLLDERGTDVTDAEFQRALRQLAAREGKDVQRFRRDHDDAWLANYRFLLARDKALREVVRERTKGDETAPEGSGDEGEDDVVEASSAPPAPGSASEI